VETGSDDGVESTIRLRAAWSGGRSFKRFAGHWRRYYSCPSVGASCRTLSAESTRHDDDFSYRAAWVVPALTYYQSAYVDVRIAVIIGIGFFFGAFLGAKVATKVPNTVMKKVFGVALLLVAVYLLLSK